MKEGWKKQPLFSVAKIFNGNSINANEKKQKYEGLKDGYPYIATKDVSFDGIVDYNNGIKVPFNTKFKIAKRDSVFVCAEGGSAGKKIAYINKDVCFGNKLFAIEPYNDILGKFICYYLHTESFKLLFNEQLVGIIGGVSMKKFSTLPIEYPPLPEQHRIVKKLDAAFEKIDAMKAKAEKNIENAKALFQQTLAEELEPKEGWVEKKLGEIGIGKMSYGSATSSKEYDGSTRYVRITDIDDDGNLQHEKKSPLFYTEKYILEDGDLLFARTGATVGKTYLYKSTDGICLYAGYLIRLKVNTRIMNPIYLFYCTKTNRYKDFIRISQKAAAQPNINAEIYSNYLVSFPQDKEIQQQIVTKLDILSAKCKKLEEAERKTIAECDALKQAILRQAFNGEL